MTDATSEARDDRTSAARWSVAVGLAVLLLKLGAWSLTRSVALLSDALESVVNVVAALVMLRAVQVARRPADEDHPFGHGKAEYASAVLEGLLIGLAAAVTLYAAWGRLLTPRPLERVAGGVAVSAIATAANAALGAHLLRVGRRVKSLALEADGHHVLADVFTSVGVVLGVGAARATGWWRLDPIVALLVALNILWVGLRLVRRSMGALMDELPDVEEARALERELDATARSLGALGAQGLRLRSAGPGTQADVRLLVDPDMSAGDAHALGDALTAAARAAHPGLELLVHVEPAATRSKS